MSIFAVNEKVEFIATQKFHYDNYSGYQYYLERVNVGEKCGPVCVEELENGCLHPRVILPPIYEEIEIRKISTPKANFDKYVVFADGNRVGEFTMVLNCWIPQCNN